MARANIIWCGICEKQTPHDIRHIFASNFIGKLLVCRNCGETVRRPLGDPGYKANLACCC